MMRVSYQCICYNIFIAQTHLSAKYCRQKFVRLLHVIVQTKLPPLTYNISNYIHYTHAMAASPWSLRR